MRFSAKCQQAECFLTANKIVLLHVTRLLFPDCKKVAMNHSDPDECSFISTVLPSHTVLLITMAPVRHSGEAHSMHCVFCDSTQVTLKVNGSKMAVNVLTSTCATVIRSLRGGLTPYH